MIEPIRFAFEVDCPVETAFALWTDGIDRWWPADHTVTGESGLRVVLEGRPGGRIYERTTTGTEHDWGEVTVWRPPERLAYLWHLRRDRDAATDVDVRFTPIEADRTRVEIVHGGWERLGAAGETAREGNRGGWATLLPHYERAASAAHGKEA